MIERIWAQVHEACQQADADYLEGEATMRLKDDLKPIVAEVLQRHIAAAIDEIASVMTDEIEAPARDRLADLRAQLESGDEP